MSQNNLHVNSVDYAHRSKLNFVESPIGVSTGRKSNLGDLGIALGSKI